MITANNTLDGSMLVENLITNHQVAYTSSVLILAESVENDQEHFVVIT